MGRLSAALLADLTNAVTLWEGDLPDGTTWRLGPKNAPQASATLGNFESRILGFCQWSEGIGRSNEIEIPTAQITIADKPGGTHSLRDMIGRGDRIQNIPFRRYLASPSTPVADWCPQGAYVLDDWSLDSPARATLKFRPDDGGMESPLLKRSASAYDWASLPDANEGMTLPLAVGKHSDEGRNCLGAIECPQIRNDGVAIWQHYVSLYRVNVLRVYRGTTLLTPPATYYTILTPLVNGLRHTIINLLADPGANTIRADIEGLYTVGTGTGVPIMTSVKVMRTVLNQCAFGAYKDGAYLAESPRIHAASWDTAETFLTGRAAGNDYCSAMFVNDEKPGREVFNAWLKSVHGYGYWRGDGSLGLFFWDPNTAPAAPSAANTLHGSACTKFEIATSKDEMLASVIAQWGLTTGSNARYQLEVANPLALTDQTATIDATYGPNTFP